MRDWGRVLIADADADMRAYICGGLLGPVHGHEAADGAETLRLAHVLLLDLVITDLRMPGLDGLALCTALHADAATAAIPGLLVSGEAPAGPGSCADGLLDKLFNAAGLRTAVERVLALPP